MEFWVLLVFITAGNNAGPTGQQVRFFSERACEVARAKVAKLGYQAACLRTDAR